MGLCHLKHAESAVLGDIVSQEPSKRRCRSKNNTASQNEIEKPAWNTTDGTGCLKERVGTSEPTVAKYTQQLCKRDAGLGFETQGCQISHPSFATRFRLSFMSGNSSQVAEHQAEWVFQQTARNTSFLWSLVRVVTWRLQRSYFRSGTRISTTTLFGLSCEFFIWGSGLHILEKPKGIRVNSPAFFFAEKPSPEQALWQTVFFVEKAAHGLEATMTATALELREMEAHECLARAVAASKYREDLPGYSPLQHALWRTPDLDGRFYTPEYEALPTVQAELVNETHENKIKRMQDSEVNFFVGRTRIACPELWIPRTGKHRCFFQERAFTTGGRTRKGWKDRPRALLEFFATEQGVTTRKKGPQELFFWLLGNPDLALMSG